MLVACFEDAGKFGAGLARRYARLAAAAVMVGTVGVGMPAEPVKGVRGTALRADDPLAQEWVVVVIGTHFGAALVARQPRPGSDNLTERPVDRGGDTSYDFAVTYDRDLVIAAAQSLMQRIDAPPTPATAGA